MKHKLILSDNLLNFVFNNRKKCKICSLLYKRETRRKLTPFKINYLTIRKESKLISYHNKPSAQKFNDAGEWKHEGRQEGKISSLLPLIFGTKVNFAPSDYEKFTLLLIAWTSKVTIKESTFDEIYNLSMKGWASSSCMEGKEECIEFYEKNSDVFTPIIFLDKQNNIVGRCNKVTCNNDFIFYDRIYYKDYNMLEAIYSAIQEEGLYYRKAEQNYTTHTSFVNIEGTRIYRDVSVNIETTYFYPYMDTLKYFYEGNNELTNYEPSEPTYYILNDTSGNYEEIYNDNYVLCCISEEYIHIDDANYIDFGRHSGEYAHTDYCMYSESNEGYCLN